MLAALFFLTTLLFSAGTAQQQCKSINIGGNAYDLTQLATPTSFMAYSSSYTFEFGICHGITTACPLADGSGFPSNCANSGSAGVCQEWSNDGTACCGQASTLVVSGISNGLSLVYSNGDNCNGCTSARSTTIQITCDNSKSALPAAGDITVTLPDSTQINIVPSYTIAFSHASACVGAHAAPGNGTSPGAPGAISAGSVMLIIIFVGFFIYMVAGIVIQRVKFEQTGVRMIPNYEFWSDLPYLVKDGFRFLINKCTGGSGGYTTVSDSSTA